MTRLPVSTFAPLETEDEAVQRLRTHLSLLDACGRGNGLGEYQFRQLAASIRWLAACAELDLAVPA